MKKLVKIKLINWHTFNNSTIEIFNNTLISGENGAGKTTLLDAIQFVLTAGKPKFNKAASENSKRTLESYVRGKVSTVDKEFLRDGDVTSYICLEFYDEVSKRTDLIGTIIEITNNINKVFFKITNEVINDDLFIINDEIKTIREFKNNECEVEVFQTKNDIEAMIKSVLGLSKDKYFELLTRALAFKPLKDVNEFVNTFLLPEDNINLENLLETFKKVNELQERIKIEEEKMISLEDIENTYQRYLDLQDEYSMYNWLEIKLNIDKKEKEINKLEKESNEYKLNLNVISNQIHSLNEEKYSLEDKLNLYNSSTKDKNVDIYKVLVEENIKIENELNNLKESYEKYKSMLNYEKKLMGKDFLNLEFINNSLYETLKNYQIQIERDKHKIKEKINDVSKEKDDISDNIYDVKGKLDRLNKNMLPYNYNVINLIEVIKKGLYNKYKENIQVRPLCEYLEIIDNEWVNAIEGYLNNQRFDLIIEPKYFDDALEIYEEEKKDKKIFGVGLVNTNELVDREVNVESLAYKVEASDIYAKRYVNNILNDVICVQKLEDLKKYNKSITKSCMVYRNKVARQINPNVYKDKFIGKKAKEELLENYKNKYKELENDYKKIEEKSNKLNNQLDILKSSKIVYLVTNINDMQNYNNLQKEKEKNELNIKKIKESPLLFDVIKEIEEIRNLKIQKDIEINEKNEEKSNVSYKIGKNEEIITSLKEEIESLKSNITDVKEDWYKKSNNVYLSNIESKKNKLNSEIGELKSDVKYKMEFFNKQFQNDQIAEFTNINNYLELLYKIREEELVSFKSQCNSLKESCQKSFREDFLANLRDLIQRAKNEIKELNKSLKDKSFGKERYQLIYSRSDDIEFGRYYDIVQSGADYNPKDLFTDTLTEEQKDDLEELFNKLTVVNLEKGEEIIKDYTDYRKYMCYDIKVSNLDTKQEYFYSKVSREKSGGEIQTPFYVMIAASFDQILKNSRRKENTGCVVLFDEAFNTMDEARIEGMMNFYNELSIQLIIAVPPNRIYNIAPYVDTNLVIVKNLDCSFPVTIKKQDNSFVASL